MTIILLFGVKGTPVMTVRWSTAVWRPLSFVTVNSHTDLEGILQVSLSMMRAVLIYPLGAMIFLPTESSRLFLSFKLQFREKNEANSTYGIQKFIYVIFKISVPW